MDWRHEASPRWIEARKDVITATEIASCLSAYKKANQKQLAGEVIFPAFASLWASKQSTAEPDTWSKGPAARGHILEPYAIKDWNCNYPDKYFYHWDDCIIKSNGLGWSPDGLSIRQETYEPAVVVKNDRFTDGIKDFVHPLPTSFIEIKSYGPERIMKCMLTMPDKLDERWQMACAFKVLDTLREGVLLFYSIDTNLSFYVTYKREDLEEEIEQIGKMVELWNTNVIKLENIPTKFNRSYTEQEVYDEYEIGKMDIISI